MLKSCVFDPLGASLCVARPPHDGGGGGGVAVFDLGGPQQRGGSTSDGGVQCVCSEATHIGAVRLVARLASTPLIVFVGAVREAPPQQLLRGKSSTSSAASPTVASSSSTDRCLHVFDLSSREYLADIGFETAILSVHLNALRLVVVLERATYIYDLATMQQLSYISTLHPVNRGGLGTISDVNAVYGNCFYAFPHSYASTNQSSSGDAEGSSATAAAAAIRGGGPSTASTDAAVGSGDVVVVDAVDMTQIATIAAHRHPIAAMQFAWNGTRLATCSTQGTNVKVWSNPAGMLLYQLRRGNLSARVHCLAFNVTGDILVAASDSGTIHLFHCSESQLTSTSPTSSATRRPGGGGDAAAAVVLAKGTAVGERGIRSFSKIYIPAKCRIACAFSENSRVLHVAIERAGPPSSPAVDGGGGAVAPSGGLLVAQYSIQRECRLLHECDLSRVAAAQQQQQQQQLN